MHNSTRVVRMLPPGHGQTIYAYCNVRTNQVLYSLERTLRQSHLKQLADVGANNNPPKLRKDMWRPLFTVSLPDQRQGLAVFKSLREYRMLHETNWELTKEITTPYTEKQIEDLQKKLDDRGGSKKETVFDIIKREKQKMRVKMVMDQKANSVADLAAILLRQEERAVSLGEVREASVRQRKEQALAEIEELARRYTHGGTEALDKQIRELKQEVGAIAGKLSDKSYKAKQRKQEQAKAKKVRLALAQARLQRQKMLHATKAVKVAKVTAARETAARAAAARAAAARAAAAREAAAREAAAAQDATAKSKPFTKTTDRTLQPTPEVDYRQYIEPFPAKLDPLRAAQEAYDAGKRRHIKRALTEQIKLLRAPLFTAEGIAIKWANALDAEYAEVWPKHVQHDHMGFVRNTAPVPDQPAAEQDSDFKAPQRESPQANWDAAQSGQQEEAVESVREGEEETAEMAPEQDREAVGSVRDGEEETAEMAGERRRTAALADVKRQILDNVRSRAGKPVWVWAKKEAARERKKSRSQTTTQTTAQPTGGDIKMDAIPAEPTSAENAPTL